jgi:hypothetical protein
MYVQNDWQLGSWYNDAVLPLRNLKHWIRRQRINYLPEVKSKRAIHLVAQGLDFCFILKPYRSFERSDITQGFDRHSNICLNTMSFSVQPTQFGG